MDIEVKLRKFTSKTRLKIFVFNVIKFIVFIGLEYP